MDDFCRCSRGWVCWTMSRIGVAMAVLVFIMLLYINYGYVSCVNAVDYANQEAEDFAAAIERTYTGPVGLETSYMLPASIGNYTYNMSLLEGSRRGLIIQLSNLRCGSAVAGAVVNAKIVSYPHPIKNDSMGNVTLVLSNMEDGVHIQTANNCRGCIVLKEFHYDGVDECHNPNTEYVSFENQCSYECDMSYWIVSDRKQHAYIFPPYKLPSGGVVTLYSGCGIDSSNSLYWCLSTNLCKAVWNNDGDTLYLRDSKGFLLMEYSYP